MVISKPAAVTVSAASVIRIPDHVVYRPFAAETVVLDLRSGTYHGLNPTGGRMLATLDGAAVAVAAEQLARAYGESRQRIEQDLCRFCEDLLERGLIELATT